MKAPNKTVPKRDEIIRLASRPEGVQTCDFPPFKPKLVSVVCGLMVKDGRLFRAKLSHRLVIFYATAEAAAARMVAGANGPLRRNPLATKGTFHRASWDADTTAHYPTNPDGTPAYKITRGVSPSDPLRTGTHTRETP